MCPKVFPWVWPFIYLLISLKSHPPLDLPIFFMYHSDYQSFFRMCTESLHQPVNRTLSHPRVDQPSIFLLVDLNTVTFSSTDYIASRFDPIWSAGQMDVSGRCNLLRRLFDSSLNLSPRSIVRCFLSESLIPALHTYHFPSHKIPAYIKLITGFITSMFVWTNGSICIDDSRLNPW